MVTFLYTANDTINSLQAIDNFMGYKVTKESFLHSKNYLRLKETCSSFRPANITDWTHLWGKLRFILYNVGPNVSTNLNV